MARRSFRHCASQPWRCSHDPSSLEIDETGTRQLSAARLLYYGSHGQGAEGPHLLKRDGWYYLFQAEGGTSMGHRETVSRADTLFGVYKPSPYGPVIRQWDAQATLQRCGHAKPVCTQKGEWYFVYLCARSLDGRYSLLGRETALDRFIWTADGWPLLTGISCHAKKPLPDARLPERIDYITPRPPTNGTIRWDGDTLRLQGSPYPLWDKRCRSSVLRRQTEHRFRFEATLLTVTGEAGITCYYDENSYLTCGVTRTADGCIARVQERIGTEDVLHEPLPLTLSGHMPLRLCVQTDGLKRTLHIYADGDWHTLATLTEVTYLADEGLRMGKRFTGAWSASMRSTAWRALRVCATAADDNASRSSTAYENSFSLGTITLVGEAVLRVCYIGCLRTMDLQA